MTTFGKIILAAMVGILVSTAFAQAQVSCTPKAISRLVKNVTKSYTKLSREQLKLQRYVDARVKSEANYDNRETAIENDRLEYVSDFDRLANVVSCGIASNPGSCLNLNNIVQCITGMSTQCVAYMNDIRDTLLQFDSRLGKLQGQMARALSKHDTKIVRQQAKVASAQAAVTAAENALAACQ